MVDTLVKLWQSNRSTENTDGLRDLVKGYEEFERVCSMWNTYIYMHDYNANSYIYISPSFCNFLGLEYGTVLSEGFESISSLIHPDDLLILNNNLFKRIKDFLASIHHQAEEENQNYRFSYNFRVRKKDGSYISMSVVSKILSFNKKGEITLDFGMISPVNHIMQTDKMILNISKSLNDLDYDTVLQEEFNPEVSAELNLTEREMEIISLLKKGMDSKEMADFLCLSQHTVRNHRRNILKKTNTNKVTELLTLINKLGL
jgi:DNA-binding CsgD family transcriptional regulator